MRSDHLDLADRLRPAILKLGRLLRREAQRVGASAMDAHLLAVIAKRPGIGVSELAAFETMSSPSMSAHVKRLEQRDWVARDQAAAGDARRARLVLTQAGERSLAAIKRSRTDWLAAQLARLPEEDLVALAAAVAPVTRLAEAGRVSGRVATGVAA